MHIKKFPKVAVVATKLNFLQYTYRIRINHKTLYSQTFPGPHFGSWTNGRFAPSSDGRFSPIEYLFLYWTGTKIVTLTSKMKLT